MGKKTPAINSSSTADIAFLLLCYFLMTTTMGSQTGLSRRLPPMPTEEQQQEGHQHGLEQEFETQEREKRVDDIGRENDDADIHQIVDHQDRGQ